MPAWSTASAALLINRATMAPRLSIASAKTLPSAVPGSTAVSVTCRPGFHLLSALGPASTLARNSRLNQRLAEPAEVELPALGGGAFVFGSVGWTLSNRLVCFQPCERAPDQVLDLAGHLGAVGAKLDHNVHVLALDLIDRRKAGVAGPQLLAFIAAASGDEPLGHGLNLGRAVDLDITSTPSRPQILRERDHRV
jgi:hypothetical protein